MPHTKTNRKDKRRIRTRAVFLSLLVLLAALAGLLLYMRVCAAVVHIRRATVWLEDLPVGFDGTRILYLTDFDLHDAKAPAAATSMMRELQDLAPDILLLGGDYASPSWLDALREARSEGTDRSDLLLRRARFISDLNAFEAPLGKYAAIGGADIDEEMLQIVLRQGGVQLLADSGAVVRKGESAIGIVGVREAGSRSRNLQSLSRQAAQSDFVIVLAHDPEYIPAIQTAEARDGGGWADLILCGGTHGGQIRLGSWSPFPLGEVARRYLCGWFREGKTVLLTSTGIGCQWIDLRLRTRAEAHLITLRRGAPPGSGEAPTLPLATWTP